MIGRHECAKSRKYNLRVITYATLSLQHPTIHATSAYPVVPVILSSTSINAINQTLQSPPKAYLDCLSPASWCTNVFRFRNQVLLRGLRPVPGRALISIRLVTREYAKLMTSRATPLAGRASMYGSPLYSRAKTTAMAGAAAM